MFENFSHEIPEFSLGFFLEFFLSEAFISLVKIQLSYFIGKLSFSLFILVHFMGFSF